MTELIDPLQHARDVFAKANLVLPSIPARFEVKFREIEPWCFSSRKTTGMAMYMFDRHIEAALTGKAPDYVAVSHAGHGSNSYALTYELVDGPLVIIAQCAFGGVYMDAAQAAADVRALFARCGALIDAATVAGSRGLGASGGRLCVLESNLRMVNACGWLDAPLPDAGSAHGWVAAHAISSGPRGADDIAATAAARQWLEEWR